MDATSLGVLRGLAARPRPVGYVLAPADITRALTADELDLYNAGLLRIEAAPGGHGHVVCPSARGREELERLAAAAEHDAPARNRLKEWLTWLLKAIVTALLGKHLLYALHVLIDVD